MPRLRAAYVEYRRCQRCGKDYAGHRCPEPDCREFPALTAERLIKELLIIDDDVIPHYERQERWRCRHCKGLYVPPSESEIVAALKRCSPCGTLPLTRQQIQTALRGTQTWLQGVRRLHAALEQQRRCPHCQHPLTLPCWCPFCQADPLPGDYLPFKPTWVYVACQVRRIPLDELADPVECDDEGDMQSIPEDPGNSADYADPDEEE